MHEVVREVASEVAIAIVFHDNRQAVWLPGLQEGFEGVQRVKDLTAFRVAVVHHELFR